MSECNNLKYLINELQCLGVRIENSLNSRKGGAGPAEGQLLIIKGIPVNCPVTSNFVKNSPYSVQSVKGRYILKKDQEEIVEILFPNIPSIYNKTTVEGIPYYKIALIHGIDCLASTVFQKCVNWKGSRCRFCGIEISLYNENTLPIKLPQQLSEVAGAALREDKISHITLTTGTQENETFAFNYLASCVREIKEKTGLPVHLQFMPPKDLTLLYQLKEAGVDTVGIHIETFDSKILKEVCPAKSRIGFKRYQECWKLAVDIFGRNQVSSFIIAGLGEERSSIIEGSEMLCELGVYPFILPFRPIPGTEMAYLIPPTPDFLVSVYQEVAKFLSQYRLSFRRFKAGCVRCGACSAITIFEGN